MLSGNSSICDPLVKYLILLLPAEQEESCIDAPVFYSGAVACSPAMKFIFRLVEILGHSDATVLITGESGTGKEVVARAIHQNSERSAGPFVAVNCGALPAELLESEPVGHVRCAFASSVRDRVGRFERASNGTHILDEVEDLQQNLQCLKSNCVPVRRRTESIAQTSTGTNRLNRSQTRNGTFVSPRRSM